MAQLALSIRPKAEVIPIEHSLYHQYLREQATAANRGNGLKAWIGGSLMGVVLLGAFIAYLFWRTGH